MEKNKLTFMLTEGCIRETLGQLQKCNDSKGKKTFKMEVYVYEVQE